MILSLQGKYINIEYVRVIVVHTLMLLPLSCILIVLLGSAYFLLLVKIDILFIFLFFI